MAERPRDLVDLQRVAEEAGSDRALRARLDALQLVTFTRNTEQGKTGLIGKHPLNGRPIFPDMRRRGNEIRPGDTWFCELEEYRPMVAQPVVYYANPIIKVDASYLFDLRSDQVDALLKALQETTQDTLLEVAKAKQREQLEKEAQARIEAALRERDDARNESDRLREELAEARKDLSVLKREVDILKMRDIGGSNSVHPSTAHPPPSESAEPPDGWTALGQGNATTLALDRPLANVIDSPYIRNGRYFVHVSPDRTRLLIRWHVAGNLVAVGGKIEIPSLEVLRPFDRAEKLRATYDLRAGGILVYLRESS